MRLIFAKLSCLQAIDVMTLKDCQGHPSSNLTKTLLRYIHGINLGPMRLIFIELLCLQTPMTSKNRSMSSIFELNQVTPEIHPQYKFGPNATNIC